MGVLGGSRRRRRLGRGRLYELILAPLSRRERLLFGAGLFALLAILVIPRVGASNSSVGSYVYAPAKQCEGGASWRAAIQATGQPDANLRTTPDYSRTAVWTSGNDSLVCGSIEVPDEAVVKPSVQLHVGFGQSGMGQSGPLTEGGNAAAQTTNQPTDLLTITDADQVNPIDSWASLDWSIDKGQTWKPLRTLARDDINRHILTIELPPLAKSDLDHLALKLTITAQLDQPEPVLVDSIGLVYQIGDAAALTVDLGQADEIQPVLNGGGPTKAELALHDPDSTLLDGIEARVLGDGRQPDVKFVSALIDDTGRTEPLEVESHWQGTELNGELRWELEYKPPVNLKPGRYNLKTQATTNGQTVVDNQTVVWGVIALNTARSSYNPGEPVEFLISVLDERGATICDADLNLKISRAGQTVETLSSSAGTVFATDTCQVYGDQNDSDYLATTKLQEPGQYDIELSANHESTHYLLRDTLVVASDQDYVVVRHGPTRLFPVKDYQMDITIKYNRDFTGTVSETIPSSFKLSSATEARPYQTEKIDDTNRLSWQTTAQAGDEQIFSYRFDAPDVSPAFYTLGRLTMADGSSGVMFTEPRQWQLAGDAIGRMLLFWDGGSAPTGWTCVSCSGGDPFYQRFIRGSDSYGATGGTTSHTHTVTATVDNTTDLMPARSNSGTPQLVNNDHAHTINPTIGSASNLPSYRQLQIIRADNSGTPASIPAGAIAMFDDSPPSGWTTYSVQDGYYIYGESTAGTTGGSNSHTHTVSGTTSASTGGERRRAAASTQTDVATPGHTHTLAGNSQSAGNEPPYRDTILAKSDSDQPSVDNMLTMWDDTPPNEWSYRSAVGGQYYQQFIKAAASFGGTGGSQTHTHPDTVLATGFASDSTTSRINGTVNASDNEHTHSVNLTNFSDVSHLPPYIDVIVAKKQPVSVLDQVAYRWFNGQDSTDVGSPLAAQDIPATATTQGTAFRLRFLIHVSGAERGINGDGLKLQYAVRSGSCDTSFIGETYADMETSSGDIRYNDYSVPADGDALTANAGDPAHSGHSVNGQSYEEANNFTNNQSAIPVGNDGLWDIALVDVSAPASTSYCFRVVRASGDLLDSYSILPEITTDDGAAHMLLLWDGGGTPSGWTCVSCNPGDLFYQRFIRGNDSFGGTGGSPDHSHTASASLSDSNLSGRGAAGTGLIRQHSHDLTPVIGDAANLPSYRQLKVIRANASGTPGTLPAGVIAFYDASVPSGWTRYTPQDGFYIRGEGTAGSTGGSNTHSHNISGTSTVPTSGVIRAPNSAGTQVPAATSSHTHTISGTSNSVNLEPPFINTILGQLDSDASVPSGLLALWDGEPPGAWSQESAASQPFFERFFKPAASYGSTGGSSTHAHNNQVITTSGASDSADSRNGGTNVTDATDTHEATISGFSTANHLPQYVDVIVGKLSGSNTNPDNPTGLDQIQVSSSLSIGVGGWANDIQIQFSADLTDSDNPDSLSICVELQPVGDAFTDNETACGSPVNFTGSPVTASLTYSGLSNGTDYHWQLRAKDSFGAYSAWISFGGNAESAADFAVDNTDPAVTVYDGSSAGVDTDFNNGSLNTLAANWSGSDAESGIAAYEYSIGTSAGAVDVTSWQANGTGTSTSVASLNLRTSQLYYFNIRVQDQAGNTAISSSDGLMVAPTISFSATPGSITFESLNSGNNYTDTQSATLTTSTNAYGGYVIRAYIEQLPTDDANSATISLFDGGSYASPGTWDNGDTGYGYTSNDNLVAGINRFNATPCSGDGNPPCWAPFSTTWPGDIIADNIGPVIASPIVDENYIITHRVSVSATQAAGTYTTTIIYTATARY